MARETTLPSSFDAERRYLTIVFIDLVGYTPLSEQLDPEDLRVLQRRYQNLALTVMERFGGFVAQFQGDGIVVYFGYPVAHENDAERAVRASLEFLHRLQNLDPNVRDGSGFPLGARVGIHTGLALIGPELLSGGVAEFSAIGEAVNLAARLQAEAPAGCVVVSRETSQLVEGRFVFEDLGPRSIKGLSRKVVIYKVIGPIPTATRAGMAPGSGATPIVGRESSIERILNRWRIARAENRCQTVAVIGDAGIGKTRLVRELCSQPELAETSVLQANCHELFSNTPLYPLVSFLWARMGLTPEDEVSVRLQKVSTFLDELALNNPENVQLIASLLGLASMGAAESVAPTPLLLKRKQYDFVINILRIGARAQPTILWVEDAHWLDASSAELLREIVASLADVPLLVLLTRRSFPRGVALPDADEAVEIKQLSGPEALEIARSIPGAQTLPDALLNRAVEAAEGVPLFLEQFMISLIEEQQRAPDLLPKPSSVPLLLAEMMSGRLDRRPGARRIVQAAACIGRSFTPIFLAALLQQEPHAVAEPLQALVEAEILLPRRYGAEIRYEFRHALLQRIAYESMLQLERRTTHQGMVVVLRGASEPGQAPLEVMAYHLTEAGEFHEAIETWLRAGLYSAQRSAHIEAIEQLRSGLALLDKIPEQVRRRQLELNLQAALIGSIMATEGATSIRVSECCQRGLELCRQGEPTPLVLPFAFGQFTFTNCRGEVQEAASLARLFLSLAESAKSESGRVIGHRMLGTVLFGQGKVVEAKEHFELSLQLYSPERDAATTYQFGQSTEVHTKSALSSALFTLGEIDRALEVGADALQSADMLRHPHSTAIPLTYVGGWVFGLCEASANLMHEARRLIALSEQHRLTAFSGHGNGLLGWAFAQQGQLEKGAEYIERAIQILESIEFRLALSGFLALLADVRRRQGNLQAAETACARSVELLAASSFVWFEPELRRIEALILKEVSPKGSTAAEEALRRAVECAQTLGFPVFERRCLISLKQLLGPNHHDFELESRLKKLSYLGDLAQRVSIAMKTPVDLLKA
jgi:class 3 adenylate cyclase/tetratricopeptide (TPR) repeat protein